MWNCTYVAPRHTGIRCRGTRARIAGVVKLAGTAESGGQATHPEGGVCSAVLEELPAHSTPPFQLAHLAVRVMSGSGERAELLAQAEIDSASIERAARQLLATAVESDR